jgi:hypothetical protein
MQHLLCVCVFAYGSQKIMSVSYLVVFMKLLFHYKIAYSYNEVNILFSYFVYKQQIILNKISANMQKLVFIS